MHAQSPFRDGSPPRDSGTLNPDLRVMNRAKSVPEVPMDRRNDLLEVSRGWHETCSLHETRVRTGVETPP